MAISKAASVGQAAGTESTGEISPFRLLTPKKANEKRKLVQTPVNVKVSPA
jgi:hypothetical protein